MVPFCKHKQWIIIYRYAMLSSKGRKLQWKQTKIIINLKFSDRTSKSDDFDDETNQFFPSRSRYSWTRHTHQSQSSVHWLAIGGWFLAHPSRISNHEQPLANSTSVLMVGCCVWCVLLVLPFWAYVLNTLFAGAQFYLFSPPHRIKWDE